MIYAVAMSGGVDSSVVAALLKSQSHNVIGFTMMQFDDQPPFRKDIHQKNIADAKAVCDKLCIPHYVIDLKQEFYQIVVNNFIGEYSAGRTPNPCALCNPTIKWGAFWEKIKAKIVPLSSAIKPNTELSFATGHYAKLATLPDDRKAICKPKDDRKDQTYMLWGLSKEQIARTIFPLSEFSKEQVRQMAKDFDLPIAEKKDSQDICFLEGKYTDFLSALSTTTEWGGGGGGHPFTPGNIILNNKTIGQHKGLPYYTLGQRKGLPPHHKPLYVKKIDSQTNTITVTDDEQDLYAQSFMIKDVNWQVHISTLVEGQGWSAEKAEMEVDTGQITVQIRYNSTLKPVEQLNLTDAGLRVVLKSHAKSITPGQSAVFYAGDMLLGGGIIAM